VRSSLHTFLPEREKADADVAGRVLTHDKRNRVQQADERTRHLEARSPLMQARATYLQPESVAMPLAALPQKIDGARELQSPRAVFTELRKNR